MFVKLVLVIREHEMKWCRLVKKKLVLLLNKSTYFRKIWRPEVLVINYTVAVDFGLVETNGVINQPSTLLKNLT